MGKLDGRVALITGGGPRPGPQPRPDARRRRRRRRHRRYLRVVSAYVLPGVHPRGHAGIGQADRGSRPTLRGDEELRVNLKGVWLMCKYVVPHMIEKASGAMSGPSASSGGPEAPARTSWPGQGASMLSLCR